MKNIGSLSYVTLLNIDTFHYIKQSTSVTGKLSRGAHADGNKFSKMLIFACELTFYH